MIEGEGEVENVTINNSRGNKGRYLYLTKLKKVVRYQEMIVFA